MYNKKNISLPYGIDRDDIRDMGRLSKMSFLEFLLKEHNGLNSGSFPSDYILSPPEEIKDEWEEGDWAWKIIGVPIVACFEIPFLMSFYTRYLIRSVFNYRNQKKDAETFLETIRKI